MKIASNTVVQFHYNLSVVGGDFTESSDSEPSACLIGHNNVMPAIEQAIMGKQAGDEVSITLPPEDAYGKRREGSIQRVPIKHLMTKGKLKPGMVVKINTQSGPRDGTIVKVGRFNVDLDTNHPLAGETLNFQLSIVDVREATPEEIAHGHAHGVGGHHH